MKQSVGQAWTIYFISMFILIVFAFLSGIINYMKAFKVNSAIANSLVNYEGFNGASRTEIDNKLTSLGYRRGTSVNINDCSEHIHGGVFQEHLDVNHAVCITEFYNASNNKYTYGITTFMYIDLPLISELKIPIYSESEGIYYFSDEQKQVEE